MMKFCCSIVAFFVLATPPLYSQIVSLELIDGTRIQGELSGYENGKYLIRDGASLKEVPDADIANVTVVQPGEETTPVRVEKKPDLAARLALVRTLMRQGALQAAEESLAELSREFPNSAEITAILDEIDCHKTFSLVEQTKDAAGKRSILLAYIERARNEAYRTRALNAVNALETPTPLQPIPNAGSVGDYFPVKAGLWYEYERVGDNIIERISIDSIIDDEGTAKIYMTHDKTFKSYKSSQTFQLFSALGNIAKDASGARDILLKNPIRVGEQWEWTEANSTFRRKYLSITDQVTTPAGVFPNCLVVEFSSKTALPNGVEMTMKSTSYYAPRVGLVKHVVEDNQRQAQAMELRNYGFRDRTYSIPPASSDQGK